MFEKTHGTFELGDASVTAWTNVQSFVNCQNSRLVSTLSSHTGDSTVMSIITDFACTFVPNRSDRDYSDLSCQFLSTSIQCPKAVRLFFLSSSRASFLPAITMTGGEGVGGVLLWSTLVYWQSFRCSSWRYSGL